ncbi:unnamed protein product [Heligmosomoides polygyrus]|uniref:TMC domain-containing protein n=1 Tax=Heligmosomoides polygyrus TaxID=6339 RepID=A0A183FF14_HELPZ|nr:unnamed protein product [Heligmosomoides polygyrus]
MGSQHRSILLLVMMMILQHRAKRAIAKHAYRVLVLYVLNYLTLIVALFDKMDAIRRKEPVVEVAHKEKRQLGGRNPNIPRPPPYASRTFENRSDLLRFIERSTRRFDPYRTTRKAPTTPFTVAPQFGPVNVNNPNAILRNGTLKKIFEAKRIGPAPLPIYTPPPQTFPPYEPGNVKERYGGPDFQTRTYDKPTTSTTSPRPKVTRPPSARRLGTESPSTSLPDSTSAEGIIDNGLSGDPMVLNEEDFLHSNETMQMPAAAERKSSPDEVYNTDICWETIIGQEIVKLVTMDLIVTIVSILVIDFLRGLWIKYCSAWWCWDIETTFPEYGEFKVAENVLHIINNQGMIWLGLFFAPLLPALNNIKLIIIMYIRGWAVMTCNVPAREIFRASRSSNFYLLILLLWLLLCTLPVGFVIASTRPSRRCGPFASFNIFRWLTNFWKTRFACRQHDHFYTVITKEIEKRVDPFLLSYIRHVASPGVVIPILLFLMLIIYFLVSLVRGLREANTDLQQQLIHERTEEKKKIFELAGGKKKVDQDRDRDHRKTIQYLPIIEQQRREPWRTFNEVSWSCLCPQHQDEPLRAEDSSESEDEDMDESPSPTPVPRFAPMPSSTSETVAAMHFHPSLGSLDEREEGEEEDSPVNDPAQPVVHSVSQHFSSNAQTGSTSESYEIQDDAIDIATPEEVRSLLRPMLEMKVMQQVRGHPRGFPRDLTTPSSVAVRSSSSSHSALAEGVHSPPTTAPPSLVLSSSRSSKRNSYISLYEYAGGATSRDELGFGAPTLITSQRSRNGQEMRAEVHRLPTTRESEEEAERRKQSSNNLPGTGAASSSSGNGNNFNGEATASAFQPWPSIDEVRARKEQLLKKTPLPFYKTHVQNTASTPQHLQQPGPSTKAPPESSKRRTSPHRRYEPEVGHASLTRSVIDRRRKAVSISLQTIPNLGLPDKEVRNGYCHLRKSEEHTDAPSSLKGKDGKDAKKKSSSHYLTAFPLAMGAGFVIAQQLL